MNTLKINKKINGFSRPAEISADKWLQFKQWAACAWKSYFSQLFWTHPLTISSRVQYEMLFNGEELIVPRHCLRVERNKNTEKWFNESFHRAVLFAVNGFYDEAEELLNECRLINPESDKVAELYVKLLTASIETETNFLFQNSGGKDEKGSLSETETVDSPRNSGNLTTINFRDVSMRGASKLYRLRTVARV